MEILSHSNSKIWVSSLLLLTTLNPIDKAFEMQWMSKQAAVAPLVVVQNQSLDNGDARLSTAHIEVILNKKLKGQSQGSNKKLAHHMVYLCNKFGFRPSFILSLIAAESSFNPNAKSSAKALGLMQIKPSTAKYIAEKRKLLIYQNAKDLYNPYINITLGIHYLHELKQRQMSTDHLLAAYNIGPTMLKRLSLRGALERYNSTKLYIEKIKKNAKRIKKMNHNFVAIN